MRFEEKLISENILALNGGYCVCYPSNIFHNTHGFENWGILLRYSPVLVRKYSVT